LLGHGRKALQQLAGRAAAVDVGGGDEQRPADAAIAAKLAT